jgi:hypothetical protein
VGGKGASARGFGGLIPTRISLHGIDKTRFFNYMIFNRIIRIFMDRVGVSQGTGDSEQETVKLAARRAGGGGKITRLYALIAGCRGIIPLPGCFYRGNAPQG